MAKYFTILVLFISSFTYGQNYNSHSYYRKVNNKPLKERVFYNYKLKDIRNTMNVVGFGYSYSHNKAHDVWFSAYGVEGSFSWQNMANGTEHTENRGYEVWNSPSYTEWNTDYKHWCYLNVKLGYQFLSFLSLGVVVSWEHRDIIYEEHTRYSYIDCDTWNWRYDSEGQNLGVGLYAKATLPLKYVQPFIYGQVTTNKNNTFGIGVNINWKVVL